MPEEIQQVDPAVWEQLKKCELFAALSPDESADFLNQYGKSRGMRVQEFHKGQLICTKGQYELDLCIILKGAVEFQDNIPGQGYIPVGRRLAPDFYGEAGAMGELPRSSHVVALEDSRIFYLPASALRSVAQNAAARQKLEQRYKESIIRILAAEVDIFQGVPPAFIEQLIPHCEILPCTGDVELMRQGGAADSMFIIRDGWVQIRAQRIEGERILAYRGPNECIGEMALLLADRKREATVITTGKCELVKIPFADLDQLMAEFPQVRASIRATVERRHEAERQLTPQLETQLKVWGQLNLIENDAVLVMDLDLCVKCDNCVKACETLHGESRLIRTGIQMPGGTVTTNYLVPSACCHCNDPKCMSSCPASAIKRRPEGEIYFDYNLCIGCGNCAIACPFDNIAMIESHKFDRAQEKKSQTLGRDFFRPYPVTPNAGARTEPHDQYPIKCDLCDGLPFMGCVHNCPTGAAIRINPRTLVRRSGLEVVPRVHKTSEASQRKFPKAITLALASSLFVLLAGSFTAQFALGWSPYWTGGYVLAGFALAALYSLRKRSLWFSAKWLDWVGRLTSGRDYESRSLSAVRWLDNLETWRSVHIVLGVGALLPLWWHIASAPVPPNRTEWLLLGVVVVLVASGILGSLIQDFFPHTAGKEGEHLVRLKDVDREYRDLLKAALEAAVGHGEELEKVYHSEIEPILYDKQPSWKLLLATLQKRDPAPYSCGKAGKLSGSFSTEDGNQAYQQLLSLAQRKVRLDQNRVNLQFTTGWLWYHIAVAIVIGVLLIFHIVGAFMFAS